MDSLKSLYQDVRSFYKNYEMYFQLLGFSVGFALDVLTVGRIDRMSDNTELLIYLLISGVLIILIRFINNGRIASNKINLVTCKSIFSIVLSFLLGTLFSTYVIYYFKSASISKSGIFFGILVVLYISNEFLKDKFNNIYLLKFKHILILIF